MELIGTMFFLFVCVWILFSLYKRFGILWPLPPYKKETRVYLKVGNPLAQDCRRCGGSFLNNQQGPPFVTPDGFCGFCENVATKIMKTELKEIKEDKE